MKCQAGENIKNTALNTMQPSNQERSAIGAIRESYKESAYVNNLGGFDVNIYKTHKGKTLLIYIFVLSLVIPLSFHIGSTRFSPVRIFIIIMFCHALFFLLSGKLGTLRIVDVLIFLFSLWGTFALIDSSQSINDSIEPAGSFFLESFGAYLIGRYIIRTKYQFRVFFTTCFAIVVFLLPFALYESKTGDAILLNFLRNFSYAPADNNQAPRMGLFRAQTVFEHPILYGTFAASFFAFSVFAISPRSGLFTKFILSFVPIGSAVLSVSTGAICVIVIQLIIIFWRWLTQFIIVLSHPWRIFFAIFSFCYIIIDLISNRTPFHIFVDYLTFQTGSAYNRILIFRFGIQEVWRHPFLGLGVNIENWERPYYMSASMDNLWLLIAIKFGLPAFIALLFGILFLMYRIGTMQFQDSDINPMRTALLISLSSLIFAATTVHYWNAIFIFFMMLIGSGVWMLDQPALAKGTEIPTARR